MPADTPDSLKQLIRVGMEDEPHFLEVTDESDGCGSKFKVIVVSDSFQGVGLLDRQRRVNTILQDPMKRIHALSLKTWTVAEYEKKKKDEASKQ